MDLTNLQKERINEILQHELTIMVKEIEKLYRLEVSRYKVNNRKVLRFNKTVRKILTWLKFFKFTEDVSIDYVEKNKKGIIFGKATHNIFAMIQSELVHNSNRELSQFRGTVRKMRRWFKKNIDEEIYNNILGKYEKGFLDGYDEGIDESLGISKKILKGHQIKYFFQTKSCIKCGLPIEKDDLSTLVRRGILCEECLPIEPKIKYIETKN